MKYILQVILLLSFFTSSGTIRPDELCPGEPLAGFCWNSEEADSLRDPLLNAFGCYELPARVRERMKGVSFPDGCPIKMSDLRYLIIPHHDGHGRVRLGEMVCHRSVARELLDIFRELYDARYPIERMVLIDDYGADDEASMSANNTSCFCYRNVAGSRTVSRHGQGKAVDINPLYNPFVRPGANGSIVTPDAGRQWSNRSLTDNPYAVRRGDAAWRAFTRRGWRWGGSWRSRKDYQHFQK